MVDVVIVGAVRSPIGKRNGGLAGCHAADLLGAVQRSVLERSGVDACEVEQVLGGCVSQVGMQAFNVTRTAWLSAGLPSQVAATTLDAQCGSSQQALNMAAAAVASGSADVTIACGVEVMSRVPLRSSISAGVGKSIPGSYYGHYDYVTQFAAAETIADKWGITRQQADAFGLQSQQRARRAWDEGRFSGQVVAVPAPVINAENEPTGAVKLVEQDEGLRATSTEALMGLRPVVEGGIHTAGTSSQISDGASAVLLMSAQAAHAHGVQPLARIVATTIVGVDPMLMLVGPIDATHRLLQRTGWSVNNIDVIENNEAFASVVLAWLREFDVDPERVNPNGGAIALGHALGSTGTTLVTKALAELHRRDAQTALVTMCCGGGLGTGTLLERL